MEAVQHDVDRRIDDGIAVRAHCDAGIGPGHAPHFFNKLTVTPPGGVETQVRAHRQAKVGTNDILIQRTAGGCGVGDPRERDAEAVLSDVVNEYVSLERAENEYGVVIDAATMTVDMEATAARRSAAK